MWAPKRVVIAARRARPVPLARRDLAPRPRPKEGLNLAVKNAERRDHGEMSTARVSRASRPPSPALVGGVPAPGGRSVCPHWQQRVAIAPRQARPPGWRRAWLARLPLPPLVSPRRAAHRRSNNGATVDCESTGAAASPANCPSLRYCASANGPPRYLRLPP